MRRSPKLVLYGSLAAVFFLLALALGRAELAGLGAPFALVLVVGLSLPRPPVVAMSFEVERDRVSERDEIEAEIAVRSLGEAVLYLGLSLPDGVGTTAGDSTLLLALRSGEERTIPLRLAADHWGGYRLGDAVWRTSNAAGLLVRDGQFRGAAPLQVYPETGRLQALVAPFETQPFAGNRVARARGDGIEFAETRPYMPGDRPRRVNWRATSLRQTLYVNEQHPEHNSDVILFLDTFAEARREGEGTLDLAVRAAATLAEHHLATRDRVGLVTFGGVVRWLTPGAGALQRYRIIEALVETEVAFSFAWRDITTLPPRSLTPHALIIAITPLLDDRGLGALLDLRRRGFDLVVVEVSPLGFTAPARGDSLQMLAGRFWRLWREAVRFRFEQAGVAVVQWDGQKPLAAAMEEVRSFRRYARRVSG